MDTRTEWTEQNGVKAELATVIHDGREFTNLGAAISETHVAGYLGKCFGKERVGTVGELTDWQGNKIGDYQIVSIWRTPRSFVSDIMCAVHVRVNGRLYKGRAAGFGMLFRGKVAKA